MRVHSTEAVTESTLLRAQDYVNFIYPKFAVTDIYFQRVPTVDPYNPFIARWMPTSDESMLVIRLKKPRGMIARANSKLDLAMQLTLTQLILQLVDCKRRA